MYYQCLTNSVHNVGVGERPTCIAYPFNEFARHPAFSDIPPENAAWRTRDFRRDPLHGYDVAAYLLSMRGDPLITAEADTAADESPASPASPATRRARQRWALAGEVRVQCVKIAADAVRLYAETGDYHYLYDLQYLVAFAVCSGARPADFHAQAPVGEWYALWSRLNLIADDYLAEVVGPRALLDLARAGTLAVAEFSDIAAHARAVTPGETTYRHAADELTAIEFAEFFDVVDRGFSVLAAIFIDGGRCLSLTVSNVVEPIDAERHPVIYSLEPLWAAYKDRPDEYWIAGFGDAYCDALARGRRVERVSQSRVRALPTFVDDVMAHLEARLAPAVRAKMAADAIWLAVTTGAAENCVYDWLRDRVAGWLD